MAKHMWGRVLVALLAALCLLPTGAWADDAGVEINEANFPDETFRESFVRTYDTDGDGWLSDVEIVAVTDIDCDYSGIASLEGIENFTALKVLNCGRNSLTSLDLSRNTALEYLDCTYNTLASLDLSENVALKELECSYSHLTALDVSKNVALESLDCSGNSIAALDVSKNEALKDLNCSGNPLNALDVSGNTALKYLSCSGNGIAALDVSNNAALKELNCSSNVFAALDVSGNAALERLYCNDNNLTVLNLCGGAILKELDCSRNSLVALDVRGCSGLKDLTCRSNSLQALDLSENAVLRFLDCRDNRLTSLNLNPKAPLNWAFRAAGNSYTIGLDAEGRFDLKKLPGGFDVDKASGWVGGTVSGSILTVDGGAQTVTYSYDCGANRTATFTLKVGYAVTFDTGEGGSAVAEQAVEPGETASRPADDPAWPCHAFAGWYADADCKTAFDFEGTKITAPTTVYAKWVAVDHTPETLPAKPATCTEDGLTEGSKCSVCGKVLVEQEVVPATGHSFTAEKAEEAYLRSAATCVSKAVYYKSCSACGLSSKGTDHEATFEYGETDPANHEALTHVAAKEATTTSEGNIEYWYCSACGKYFSDAGATKEVSQADIVIAKKSDSKGDDGKGNGGSDKKSDEDSGKRGDKGSGKKTIPATGDNAASAAPLALVGGLTALGAALLRKKQSV